MKYHKAIVQGRKCKISSRGQGEARLQLYITFATQCRIHPAQHAQPPQCDASSSLRTCDFDARIAKCHVTFSAKKFQAVFHRCSIEAKLEPAL